VFKGFSVAALALVLAACVAPKARHPMPQSPAESPPPPGLPLPGRAFRIDESQSELRILVYRAGPLAHLGHNHVMVNRAVRGTVNWADEPGASVFSLTIPAAAFVVDDAQARSEEGPDFSAQIPEDAKSGTLHNMLSAAVLDADEFPSITINSVAAAGAPGESGGVAGESGGAPGESGGAPGATTPGAVASGTVVLTATVAISVAGHESKLEVPFTLQFDSSRLSATGSMEVRQSTIGLTPYSLMLGALQVQDVMKIKFKFVAVPSP
jgi:YceI-like domain